MEWSFPDALPMRLMTPPACGRVYATQLTVGFFIARTKSPVPEAITAKSYRGVEAFSHLPDTDHKLLLAALNRSHEHALL